MKTLFAIAVTIFCLWGFIIIADKISETETRNFDRWAIRILRDPDTFDRPLGPDWLPGAARDVTALGGYTVLGIVVAAAGGYFVLKHRYARAFFLLGVLLGGVAACHLLKLVFSRPRPDIEHMVHVATYSFPSGHAMLSAAVYLTLGIIASRMEPFKSYPVVKNHRL